MKAGHATLRTNTALSYYLSGKTCGITLLCFSVHADTSHSVNTTNATPNPFPLHPPDCLRSFVHLRHVAVCRYCTRVCPCEYNSQIIPLSSPSTLISSCVSPSRGLAPCEFPHPICSSSYRLLAHILDWLCSLALHK